MPSTRNVLFLALTAGLGILVFLVAKGALLGADPTLGGDGGVIVRTTAVADRAAAGAAAGDGAGPVVLAQPGSQGADAERAESAGGTTVIWPLEVELLLALSGAVDAASDALPIRSGANAGIVGQIRGPSGRPASASVRFVHGPNQGRVLTTDSRGNFGASDLWEGVSIVRVTLASGPTAEREVRLAQLNTTRFNLSFSNPSFVSGLVKDQRGVVIEGAEVRVDGRLAYTDIEGRFTLSSVPAGKIVTTVRKAGFATERRLVAVGVRSSVLPENFVIQLAPSASVEISVGARVGAAESSYAILMPAAGPGTTAGAGSFPWYEINPVEIPLGGRAVVDGLPAESVSVRVFHRGALGRPRSMSVRLYPGQKTPVTLDLEPAPTISGRVVEDGTPVRGVTVELEAADLGIATTKALEQKPRGALEFVMPRIPTASDTTRTDDKGRFVFTSHPDLITTYYLTATSADGKRRGVAAVRPADKDVTVALTPIDEQRGTVELDLPGRFQGLPVEVTVNGTPREPFELRPGEPLVVDGLERGTWRLRAKWQGDEVVPRRAIEVLDAPAKLSGALPRAAIEGQTREERDRAAMREQ